MSGTIAAPVQRRADPHRFDRLTLALGAGPRGVPVSEDEAIAESAQLYDEAMRGDFGPWTVSRSIDLATQWPERETLQLHAAHLIALTSDDRAKLVCWRALLERFPDSEDALREYTRALAKAVGDEKADAIFKAYRPDGERFVERQDAEAGIEALEILIAHALDWRAAHPPVRARGKPGPITLIGGTLGGGGAERQLVNTALGLEESHDVTVYCRKLDARRGHDFYLPRLEAAGVRVADYLRAEEFGGSREHSRLAPLMPLIDKLPHRMREGTIRLTELLRYESPDVVQIWQDGSIFAAGLAALLANVPRIVLTVRTMPPSQRADRRKPEQEALYHGLLRADGVTLTANSAIAARAYEEWLGLAEGAVEVVHNGVEPLPTGADAGEQARWAAFNERTGDGFVLGGVVRLDDNKRPLDWLEIAAALAAKRPDARFALVGTGPLRSAAEDFARRKGIAERTLFVGRSSHVGFWLEKMDALALTSRHEGVPNVLIEAQLAGVPVVTTPAGGAAEAVAPHPANLVLGESETVAHEEAAAHLAGLEARADHGALRQWAEQEFAIGGMINRTLEIFVR